MNGTAGSTPRILEGRPAELRGPEEAGASSGRVGRVRPAPVTMHEFRRTFASVMLAPGVDRGEVMRQIGHKATAMLDRYKHRVDGSVGESGADLGLIEGRRAQGRRRDPRRGMQGHR